MKSGDTFVDSDPELMQTPEVVHTIVPVLRPVDVESADNTVEVEARNTRESGRGSYAESGIINEGENFDPKNPTLPYPEEWYTSGPVSPKEKYRAHAGSGTVRVPAGTLCYRARGSNSGYNSVTLFRAGSEVEHTECMPAGWRPGRLFRHFPPGSYVALPGERGIINPEYTPPWVETWKVNYHSSLRADTVMLLRDPADATVSVFGFTGPRGREYNAFTDDECRWVPALDHPDVSLTKESSRRGRVEGTARIETSNPDIKFGLVRRRIGQPWQIRTWREIYSGTYRATSPLSWEEFAEQYRKLHDQEPPAIPEVETVLKRPARPFEGNPRADVEFFAYRTADGELFASPAKPTGMGRSRTFEIKGSGVVAIEQTDAEYGNRNLRPITDGETTISGEWWKIPEEGTVTVGMMYASGNDGGEEVVHIQNIPQERGMYAVWSDGKESIVAPASFELDGTEFIAVDPFCMWEYVQGKNQLTRRQRRHWDDEDLLDHQNSIVQRARTLHDLGSAFGETWVHMENDDEMSAVPWDDLEDPHFNGSPVVGAPTIGDRVTVEQAVLNAETVDSVGPALERDKLWRLIYDTRGKIESREAKLIESQIEAESNAPDLSSGEYYGEDNPLSHPSESDRGFIASFHLDPETQELYADIVDYNAGVSARLIADGGEAGDRYVRIREEIESQLSQNEIGAQQRTFRVEDIDFVRDDERLSELRKKLQKLEGRVSE